MSQVRDKVLVIDPDPQERAMLVEAALEPFGYAVQATEDGNAGLSSILSDRPDAIIMDMNPAGLSGPDILAALSSQAIDIPVIVIADRGREQDALHAFRLGAKDYVVRPVREAELIQVVERALKEVRVRREREGLIREINQASGDAEQRLRELRTIMALGKAVTSSRNLEEVFDRVVRAAIQLTRAEAVGVFERDEQSDALILRAGQNLSRNLLDQIGQPVEDNLASVVMSSHETYLASGEGLRQFRPAQEGATSVIYAPLVVQDNPVGLLWVANTHMEFATHMKDIMTALADYSAIAVANARLFSSMSASAQTAPAGLQGQAGGPPASELADKLRGPLTHLLGSMNLFRTGEMGVLPMAQQAAVDVMHRELTNLVAALDQLVPPDTGGF